MSEPTIRLNGEVTPLRSPSLAALIAEHAEIPEGGRGVAVAVNGAVVRRAEWDAVTLAPGDTVEIVLARQGG
jgi:sulfur carrier protein